MKPLKLTIDLVPSTTWKDNLRKAIPKSAWDKLRKRVYAKFNFKCGICDANGRLSCHEIWDFDDEQHIQKLNGFIALCDLCHHVKHIGMAGILASQGKLDMEKVINHFLMVNCCDLASFEKHKAEAFNLWHERSKYSWQVDLGEYENLIN